MNIADLTKTRSTCIRRQIGAVAVVDKRIITTGYNGAPKGCAHCLDLGCLRNELGIPSGERQEICRAVHAEQNVVAQAASNGQSLKGATLYVTEKPCMICAKIIINSGINTVIYKGNYPDTLSLDIMQEAGLQLFKVD
jgi:dCMP deaminase